MEKGTMMNLTPHDIDIFVGEKNMVIPISGNVARVEERSDTIGNINGIPIIRKTFGKIIGLPDPSPNVIYVVSLLVAQAAKRTDVLTIGESIRNDKGQVVGARSLAMI